MSYQRGLFAPTPDEYEQLEMDMDRYIVIDRPGAFYAIGDTWTMNHEYPRQIEWFEIRANAEAKVAQLNNQQRRRNAAQTIH